MVLRPLAQRSQPAVLFSTALRPQQLELIGAPVAENALGGITTGLLEKDEHLTDALRALFALRAG